MILETIRPISNHVLVRVTRKANELKLNNGETLYIDPSYEEEKHAPSEAVVVAVPEKVFYSERNPMASNEFDTDMEIQVGDSVIFHFLTILKCVKEKKYLLLDNEVFFWIKYDTIYIAKRADKIIPVNGWVVVEADDIKVNTTIELPEHLKSSKSLTSGTIKYCATPLRGYLSDFLYKTGYVAEQEDIKEGDHVVFDKLDSIPLEYELHSTLDKGKTLYRMQRKDIFYINQMAHE